MTTEIVEFFNVPIKDIIVKDRGRQVFTRIIEMAESIKKFGILEPIVLRTATEAEGLGKFVLVAGERRYRGCILAARATIPATLRDGAEDLMVEIELEENVCREDISFEEQGLLFERIQKLRKKQSKPATMEDVADIVNRSTGDVSSKIKIAKKFRERPDLKERCGDGKMPYTATLKKIEQIEESEKIQRLADSGQIKLTTELRHGDCRNLIKDLPDGSVDLLLCDPPYGLEKLETIRKNIGSAKFIGHQLMSESHNMSILQVTKLLRELAPELYRVMKPGAHFYMFCGFQYVGAFIEALNCFDVSGPREDVYLEFQPPLLVWDRGRPSGPAYGYSYLSKLEAIIFGHRPPRGIRLQKDMYNLFECPDVPKNLRIYPTEKPVPLLQTLIKNSTNTGGMVLDPFAGSGSTLVAAKASGRKAIGFEIDKEAFLRTQQRLLNGDAE